MREYFCAFHSMRNAMRKLTEAEVGRLFIGLLYYSETGEQPTNLRGREELLFDVFSQQIDREREKYQETCSRNKSNRNAQAVTSRDQSSPVVTSRHQSSQEEEKEKEEDKEEHKEKVKREKRFAPPTVEEVRAYCTENGYAVNPARFVDYYTSKGWTVGRSPMRDWKAAVRQWAARDKPEKPAAPAIDISAAYGGDVL